MSLNSRVIQYLIIGIGLVSSLAAFLMILNFAGLKPDNLQGINISYWTEVSVTDILTGLANGLVTIIGALPSIL